MLFRVMLVVAVIVIMVGSYVHQLIDSDDGPSVTDEATVELILDTPTASTPTPDLNIILAAE